MSSPVRAAGVAAIRALSRGLGLIAFASDRDGDFEIFVMRADGSHLRQITHNRVDDNRPTWSPDGEWIAFVRTGHPPKPRIGTTAIWKVRANGADEKRLVWARWDLLAYPDWSPDGRWIAYSASYDGASVGAVSADGRRDRSIVPEKDNSYHEDPSWSPDGKRVVYVEEGQLRSAASRCHVALGCDVIEYEQNGTGASNPTWSPDGSTFLYAALEPGSYGSGPDFRDVWIAEADGTATRFEDGGWDSSPGSWSPDGKRIVFYSGGGSFEIYVMDTEGRNRKQLTDHPADDVQPDWI